MKDRWQERWKAVVGFEGLYQVSNLGRVRSLDRIVPHKLYGTMKVKGRIRQLSPGGKNRMYLMVTLSKNGVKTGNMVHHLVAAAWFGPRPDGQEVCHGKNGQRDNSVCNLRYDTRVNNGLDRRRDGTHGGRPVRRSDGVEYINMQVAAEETDCYSNNIWKVCQGKRKRAGGCGWEYV